jgi:hypothetical protein
VDYVLSLQKQAVIKLDCHDILLQKQSIRDCLLQESSSVTSSVNAGGKTSSNTAKGWHFLMA